MKTMKEIYDWVKENIAVSDFGIIESSDAVLENKQGNVHSIANLLESMLIENGYECKKVFIIESNYFARYNGIAKITKLKPGEGCIRKTPFINTVIICNINNKYYCLNILNDDIEGPSDEEYNFKLLCRNNIIYELVHYDVTKDYTGIRVQDYVFDVVNGNIRYGKNIWYPVYE